MIRRETVKVTRRETGKVIKMETDNVTSRETGKVTRVAVLPSSSALRQTGLDIVLLYRPRTKVKFFLMTHVAALHSSSRKISLPS